MTEPKLVRCPETGELVEVDLGHTSSGILVDGCTRFHPACALTCSRSCAVELDHRNRVTIDTRERVLVVLANLHDDAARMARWIVKLLRDDRLAVDIADLSTRAVPPLADYDAVMIGAAVRLGRHRRAIIDYVRDRRRELAELPAFFFSVGGHGVFWRHGYIERMTRRTGWHPTSAATFADAGERQRTDVEAFARDVADDVPVVDHPSML